MLPRQRASSRPSSVLEVIVADAASVTVLLMADRDGDSGAWCETTALLCVRGVVCTLCDVA